MDNIIFIIFVFLFIIVLLGLNTNINQEGFDVTTSPDNSTTTTPSFITTGVTNPSFITDVTTAAAATTTPSFITDVTTAAATTTTTTTTTTPLFFTETTTPVSVATTTPTTGTFATTTVGSVATTTPGSSSTATTTSTISSSTTTPPGFNLSNTSLWFDPKFIDYWANSFAPTELRYKPYNVTLYNVTTNPDPNGILTPTATNPGIVFNNYLKIAFDNTNTDYNNFTQNPIVSVQTKVKNIPVGNYLMTYYVSSSTNTTDTQSISVTSGVNSSIGTPFILRNFVTGGTWVKQQYAFSIKDATENTIQFQFELFDTKSPGFCIVAVGGIDIQSCGNQPCNIDCTTYYTDWGVCDITKGVSTRNAELISRNSDTTCPVPLTTGNCLDAVNFKNSLTGWNITTTPVDALTNNTIKIPVFTPSTITNAYQFNVNNIPFNTPFTVVNFLNSTTNTFTGNISPTATISTSLKLQAGNYRISYYVQSSETQQLINVSSVFGSGTSAVTTQVVPSNVVNPLEWYLVTTNILVATDSIVPIQFVFTLKDTKSLISSAIALGGISLSYCGNKACATSPPSISTTTPYNTMTTTPYNTTTTTPYNIPTTSYNTITTTASPTTIASYPTTTVASPTIIAVAYPTTTNAVTSPTTTIASPTTTPTSCFTDWTECKINNNSNITMDMLTDKMKTDIQSYVDNFNNMFPSNNPYTLEKFIDNYNDTLIKSYTKTRKLNSNASQACVNSATLKDLLMTNCSIDCKYDGWNKWSTCNEKGTVDPPLIDKNSDYAKDIENNYPGMGIVDSLNNDIIQQYKEHSVRTRTQHTRPAQNGGQTCPPSKPETDFDCPIDCQYKGWSNWGACDTNNNKTRFAMTTPPSNGGASCTPGSAKDTTLTSNNDCNNCSYTSSSIISCENGYTTRRLNDYIPAKDGGKCYYNDAEITPSAEQVPIPFKVGDTVTMDNTKFGNRYTTYSGVIREVLNNGYSYKINLKNNNYSYYSNLYDITHDQIKDAKYKPIYSARTKEKCGDCTYNGWSDWNVCDGNSTTRNRYVKTSPPYNKGKTCTPRTESKNDCAMDCSYSSSKIYSCDGGNITRILDKYVPPKNNGKCYFKGSEITVDSGKVKIPAFKYDIGKQKYFKRYTNNGWEYYYGTIQKVNDDYGESYDISFTPTNATVSITVSVDYKNIYNDSYGFYNNNKYWYDNHWYDKVFYKYVYSARTNEDCNNCNVNYVSNSGKCDKNTGKYYYTFTVTNPSNNMNDKCYSSDGHNILFFDNKVGNYDKESSTCRVDCSYNKDSGTCSEDDGYTYYKVTNYNPSFNGGAECYYNRDTKVTQVGQKLKGSRCIRDCSSSDFEYKDDGCSATCGGGTFTRRLGGKIQGVSCVNKPPNPSIPCNTQRCGY